MRIRPSFFAAVFVFATSTLRKLAGDPIRTIGRRSLGDTNEHEDSEDEREHVLDHRWGQPRRPSQFRLLLPCLLHSLSPTL